MLYRFMATAAALFTFAISSLAAPPYCGGCPGSYPNTSTWSSFANYQNVAAYDPQYGYCMTLAIADPTILVINDAQGRPTFYMTGTCDDYNTRNFAIYKSNDLRDWCWHMAAFPFPASGQLPSINGRRFDHMWSPQLYISPNDPNTVYLAFAAVEEVPLPDGTGTTTVPVAPYESGSCGITSRTEATQYVTSMVCQMPKANFVAASHQFGSSSGTWDDYQPAYYTYTKNNGAGSYNYDGGEMQGAGSDIPVTGSMWMWGPYCGQADRYVWGFNHRCHQAAAWIGDAPFVAFTQGTKKPYLFYTWTAYTGPAGSLNLVNGNNISMFPMLNDEFRMDAYGTILHAAYRSNVNDPTGAALPAGVKNGCSARVTTGSPQLVRCHASGNYPGGVAEGPSLWYEPSNQRYYVFYSRNTWDSSDYQICYRKSAPNTSFATASSSGGLAMTFGDEYAGEKTLVRSDPPSASHQVHYGNGEIFRAWGVTYLVCHARVWLDEPGRTPGWYRTVYFKELTFLPNGDIQPLTETDMAYFWGPL